MEHSDEYYKMKYFKYKAKYIAELERQKGGGVLNFLLHVDAKNYAIKNAFKFLEKIKGADFNKDAELKKWENMKEFDKLYKIIDDLGSEKDGKSEVEKYIIMQQKEHNLDKYFGDQFKNKVIAEFKSVRSSLERWCKNTFPSNSIDKNCINNRLKDIVNKVDETPVKKKK